MDVDSNVLRVEESISGVVNQRCNQNFDQQIMEIDEISHVEIIINLVSVDNQRQIAPLFDSVQHYHMNQIKDSELSHQSLHLFIRDGQLVACGPKIPMAQVQLVPKVHMIQEFD
jgi:hypothetical protein